MPYHTPCFRLLILASVFLLMGQCVADEASEPTDTQLAFVRNKVLPLLESRCFECHKHGEEQQGSLLLSSRQSMLRGGDSGPAIVPGKPNDSLIVQAVRYEGFEMPPRTRMPAAEVAILEKWIADGAHWPTELDTTPAPVSKPFPLQERRTAHWAWQPISNPSPPAVQSADWGHNSVDAFVRARQQQKGTAPGPDADRYTILRRLNFDIIGLPPSIEEIEAFVNDEADDDTAIANVVDRLLASPHFGERWGRHWLDLVRYAETRGHEFDYPLHYAWRYRDYVIRAFNADVPYNDFVREHVAGDLLQRPRLNPTSKFNESVIGTGFWFLNEGKHAPVDVRAEEAAMVDNQIDVFSKTFLGMTVACARCHDHKFDAIATKDYYALAGYLRSSRQETTGIDQNNAIAFRVEQLQHNSAATHKLLTAQAVSADSPTRVRAAVLAALQVVQKITPDVESAAAAHQCEAADVQRWVTALQLPAHKSPTSLLSLPFAVANSKPDADLSAVFERWQTSITASGKASTNEQHTIPLADLRDGIRPDWFTTGQAFEANRDTPGRQLHWTKAGLRINPTAGVNSALLSTELRGTLTSPTFELTHPEILVRVAGEGSRMRLVIDGYSLYEFNGLLFNGFRQAVDTGGEYRWLRFAGDLHRYLGHRVHLEFLDEGNGWMDVQEIRFATKRGAQPAPPSPAAMNQSLAASGISAETIKHQTLIDAWLESMAAMSHRRFATAELFNAGLLPASPKNSVWTDSVAAWKTRATGVPAPMSVIAMTEGTPLNEYVFIRGNHRNLGEEAPRSILTALRAGDPPIVESGSGRLQLAEQLVAADNPLTSRVIVNRIWHHLFGAGLVESTDNFGVLGKRPTHPELLDHLATKFQQDGWSIKRMIRTLTLSRTYRISGDRSTANNEIDPTNQLLHSARIRRLQGEAVRDAILTVSGRLDRKQFGAPTPVHLTAFMQGRGRPRTNGPLDGAGRRSIYIAINRNFLSPFMLAFDVPAPVTTTGRRTSSNVPAQALIMLNNAFVNQQAEVWASKLLAAEHGSPSQIIHTAWYELFGRPPAAAELQPLLDYVDVDVEGDSPPSTLAKDSLTQVCHILLNSKEFLFLR